MGTRKVLLMVSAHSRVYGMASWTGEVLWARTIVGARDVRYHQVRHATSHDPVGVLTYVDAATGTVAVVAIDPVTGRELPDAVPRNALGALRPEWVYAVTPATPTEGYGVLFVATDGQAVLVPVRLPGGHEATAPTARLPAPLYFFHTTSGPSPAIECVRVHQAADGAVVGTRAWRIPLAPGEEVVAQAHRTPGEHVATIGRVLGNRSVLYKYLNPHLYAVATLRVGLLRVRIVDGVTGVLLHESVQKDVEGPVTLVACEHWVVYSYVDAASQVTEMVVIELYESHEPNKRDERCAPRSTISRSVASRGLLMVVALRRRVGGGVCWQAHLHVLQWYHPVRAVAGVRPAGAAGGAGGDADAPRHHLPPSARCALATPSGRTRPQRLCAHARSAPGCDALPNSRPGHGPALRHQQEAAGPAPPQQHADRRGRRGGPHQVRPGPRDRAAPHPLVQPDGALEGAAVVPGGVDDGGADESRGRSSARLPFLAFRSHASAASPQRQRSSSRCRWSW